MYFLGCNPEFWLPIAPILSTAAWDLLLVLRQ